MKRKENQGIQQTIIFKDTSTLELKMKTEQQIEGDDSKRIPY